MTSFGYQVLTAVCAVGVAIFGVLAHRQKKIEDQQKSGKSDAVTQLRHSEVTQGIGGLTQKLGAIKHGLDELKQSITSRTTTLRESPPTTHAINAIEHVLFSNKVTRRLRWQKTFQLLYRMSGL